MSVSGIGNFGVASAWSGAVVTKDKSANALALLAATTTRGAAIASSPAAAASKSSVTLGAAVDTEVVYTKPLTLSFELDWASSPTDDTSALMQKNMHGNSSAFWNASSLLDGLGAQLLDRFSTTSSDFSQSVVSSLQDSSKSTNVARAASAQALAAQVAPNRIGLTITTVSGKAVNIAIAFGGDGSAISNSLSVEVLVDGELTADEQKAVAQLSAGFQAALDGLTKVPPTVDFSGLVDYDASVLSGVDLSVRQTPRLDSELKSLDFHVDAKSRSFSMESVSGKLAVSVDLSQSLIRGSAEQQATALKDYLQQFDAANQRGHGDAKLIAQFKAAFSQLNSNYPAAAEELTVPLFNAKDRSLLSGLADFTASMSGDFTDAAEGRVTTEEGHIEYRASQTTMISGRDKYSGLTVSQTQRSSLKSDYVKSRNGAMLDTGSGNYDSYSIRDESSTTTSFSYVKDKLKSASVERLVKQLESYAKLVDHKVVERRETPRHEATRQDLSEKLLPSYKAASLLA